MAPLPNDLTPPDEQVIGGVAAHTLGQKTNIFLIKVVHSFIYLFMSMCLVYIYYAALARTYDWKLVFAVGMMLLETVILLGNGRRCPLSTYAKHLGDKTGNDLIGDYLPQWAVKRTVPICTFVFLFGLALLGTMYVWG